MEQEWIIDVIDQEIRAIAKQSNEYIISIRSAKTAIKKQRYRKKLRKNNLRLATALQLHEKWKKKIVEFPSNIVDNTPI